MITRASISCFCLKLNVPTLRAPRSARACVRAFAFAFALALALALARPGRCRSACLPPAPIILLAVRSASYSFCQRAPPFLLFCCCCFHKARMRMNSSIDCQYVRESCRNDGATKARTVLKKNKISVGDTASTFGVVTRGSTVQTGRLA